MTKYMLIHAPHDDEDDGWGNLGDTPVNDDLDPTDGSYGLYDYCERKLPKSFALKFAEFIEENLVRLCKEDLGGTFMGFRCQIIDSEE